MCDVMKTDKVTLQELMVSTLAMTDATIKLLIQKGVFYRGGVHRPVRHRAGELCRCAEAPSLKSTARSQLLRNGNMVRLFSSPLGLPDLLVLFWRCFFVALRTFLVPRVFFLFFSLSLGMIASL
jgi:hypothetical protein